VETTQTKRWILWFLVDISWYIIIDGFITYK
jgi:hypothetical protein